MNFGPGWAASTWQRLLPRCGPSIRPTTPNASPQDGSSDVDSNPKWSVKSEETVAVRVAQFVQHVHDVADVLGSGHLNAAKAREAYFCTASGSQLGDRDRAHC